MGSRDLGGPDPTRAESHAAASSFLGDSEKEAQQLPRGKDGILGDFFLVKVKGALTLLFVHTLKESLW